MPVKQCLWTKSEYILTIITITTTDYVLQSGVGGITGNSTLVVLVSNHHDVAIHTPVGSPAVFVCVCVCLCVHACNMYVYVL